MNRKEIDKLWNKALRDAVEAGEMYTRYHFYALVAAHLRETEFKPDWNNYNQGRKDGAEEEREACLKIADDCADADMHASIAANAIRARGQA